jgi:hypothetical protein
MLDTYVIKNITETTCIKIFHVVLTHALLIVRQDQLPVLDWDM